MDTEKRREGGQESEGYQVERVFIGDRTAEQVVADLIKAHAAERG